MSDNVTEFPQHQTPEFMLGPMTKHPVVIEGRVIPKLEAYEEGDRTFILVDGRICISVPHAQAYDVCFIVATALAVGAGYTHIHAESKDTLFAPRCNIMKELP